jgi:hypothetical protein
MGKMTVFRSLIWSTLLLSTPQSLIIGGEAELAMPLWPLSMLSTLGRAMAASWQTPPTSSNNQASRFESCILRVSTHTSLLLSGTLDALCAANPIQERRTEILCLPVCLLSRIPDQLRSIIPTSELLLTQL